MRSVFLLCITLSNVCLAAGNYLTPLDFGLSLLDHGMVDYCTTPPNILCGNYNNDDYIDIACFDGSRLEIFICTANGYNSEPQQSRTFPQSIISLDHDDDVWDGRDDLVVTLEDNSTQTFRHHRGHLDLGGDIGSSLVSRPPRTIDVADFEIVWESESYPEEVDECIVGDLDGDGIMEFVACWAEDDWADTSYILIYKNNGDNSYELFMEEPFFDAIAGTSPDATFFLITDIDQNGINELMFTYDGCYFWEFSAPGEYIEYRSNFIFPRGVRDAKISDVDQDSVLEVATVLCNPDLQPPTAYYVCEYQEKDTVDFMMNFDIIAGIWQDWPTARLAVGDFDNDGAVDIVQGNHIVLSGPDPVDVPFYRHYPGSSGSFQLYWLETGLVIRCACPVIEDFDCDGDLDLFAEGFTIGAGAAFVWEGTGLLSGYVSWVDTVSSNGAIDFSNYGCVDGAPAIVSSYTPTVAPTTTSVLSLWRWENGGFDFAWETDYLYNSDYRVPHLADMDGDGKVSILLVDDDNKILIDWEQLSTGVWDQSEEMLPDHFRLNPVYPNPFNVTAIISYELTRTSDIHLFIYDISGRVVHQLHQENIPPGYHTTLWNAAGHCSGVYLIELRAREHKQIRKGVLSK